MINKKNLIRQALLTVQREVLDDDITENADLDPTTAFHVDLETTAEQYVSRRMDADQVQSYEFHLWYCPPCANQVNVTTLLVEGLRKIAIEEKAHQKDMPSKR